MSLWGESIARRLTEQTVQDAMRTAAIDVLADASDRIFEKGLDSSNDTIGQYSTKPIYISKKNSPKKAGIEKKSTYYFPGGYKQFKSEIKGTSKVNLQVFGRLRNSYKASKEVVSGYSLKYELNSEESAQKKEWVEENFNKDIFSLTKDEIKTVQKTFQFELIRRLNQ
jgi:hypothetical protein